MTTITIVTKRGPVPGQAARTLAAAIGAREARTMQTKSNRWAGWKLAAITLCPAAMLLAGCQVEMAGQTLPSPYYLSDDVQYYAPASEFKLAREAAAMKEQSEAVQSQAQEA